MADVRAEPLLGADPALFPNTRLRAAVFRAGADGLSSASRLNPTSDPALSSEPDTCRICRGESTPDEPLFYPCKCSGSIKYVHQNCLMEWLSHSQKKHCELCKTPFRFTKLYAPNMPKSLPLHVFASHMAKYLFCNFLIWLRAVLVISVWLGWLPYVTRLVWSILFWICDQGLGGGVSLLGRQSFFAGPTLDISSASINSSAVCPSSPLFAATSSVATAGEVFGHLPSDSMQLIKSLYGINFTLINPLYAVVLRLLFGGIGISEKTAISHVTGAAFDKAALASPRRPTLLSKVEFLQNLTRHPALNRIIVAILEGQIITILVIVCFILIILVRDYVVQQQPEINMRAAFAAAEIAIPAQLPVDDVDVRAEDADNSPGPENEYDRGHMAPVPNLEASGEEFHERNQPSLRAPEDGSRGQLVRLDNGHDNAGQRVWEEDNDDVNAYSSSGHQVEYSQGSSAAPAPVPPSPILGPYLSFETNGSPSSSPEGEGATVHEYLRIYREAGGDPTKVLRMVQEEHLEDKLDYWIRLTRSMMDRNQVSDTEEPAYSAQPGLDIAQEAGTLPDVEARRRPETSGGSDQSSEWNWPDESQQNPWSNAARADKGKGILEREQAEPLDPSLVPGKPLRPRANSDGPQVKEAIHLLANNNWSFSDLPAEPLTASTSASFGEPLFKTHAVADCREPQDDSDCEYPTPPSSALTEGVASMQGNDTVSVSVANGSDATDAPEADPYDQLAIGPRIIQPGTPDFNLNIPRAPIETTTAPQQPIGFIDRVADFMWRDVDRIDPAELAGVDDVADFPDNNVDDPALLDDDDNDNGHDGHEDDIGIERDREVVEAAVAAGLDPDAIEEAEDLEGILELLGMRGPIAGLFQNAIFCAFLVLITLFFGAFVPYNIGRFVIWMIANPVRPARILFSISKFLQDCAIVIVGLGSCGIWSLIRLGNRFLGMNLLGPHMSHRIAGVWQMSVNAGTRIMDSFMTEFPIISAGEMRNFSALSHEALLTLKSGIMLAMTVLGQAVGFLIGGNYAAKGQEAILMFADTAVSAWELMGQLPDLLFNPGSWVINLSLPEAVAPVDPEMAYWDATDRFYAILGGYMALSLAAALYLRRGTPFSSGRTGQEWEASIIDGLNQASGVMKVILIIGIEMLIFPLYCGLLLDVALLPLFENTTVVSRVQFTMKHPLTSIFVHWFVGTGYMFHFALFVSMCRKIMRKGVLYFIRDPDDPEFHPVRDVLDRSVTTQLRKILFSAFVYGALVLVCLGGVVWGLSFCLPNVLPIHYSSNEPVLEFPIDLLFYNFLMPMAVNFFKPSDGLHAMYTWWFRRCARALRITWFLFGERRIDEEGVLRLRDDSAYRRLPWWRTLFLEFDSDKFQVVPKGWRDIFRSSTAQPRSTIPMDEMIPMNATKILLVRSRELVPDGRFVRTPASDQVKIPKGRSVFLEVTESNMRKDEQADQAETDLFSTDQYRFVYIPPHFRFRVFLFILLIWIFAAVTGVGITIVPLLFGRQIFRLLIPAHIRTNDIYAFSIGIYMLGSASYTMYHIRAIHRHAKNWVRTTLASVSSSEALRCAAYAAIRATRLAYAYCFILIILPILVASLMELYALIPLHTYMYGVLLSGDQAYAAPKSAEQMIEISPRHNIRVIQAWTIGLLYLKLSASVITTWFNGTRLAAAVRAVLRRGWLDPDIGILTRAFIVPGLVTWTVAVATPLLFAKLMIANGLAEAVILWSGSDLVHDAGIVQPALCDAYLILIYRLSFPFIAVGVAVAASIWSMVGVFHSLKIRIRDEAYLVGERLHNFGVNSINTGGSISDPRVAWKAGAGRF